MKHLYCLIPLLFPVFLNAQTEFAPLGATWYYDYSWGFPWILNYAKAQVVEVVTIQGKVCKRIVSHDHSGGEGWGCSFYAPELFLHEENGKVYSFHSGGFYLMYDFNAGPGESWVIHNPPLCWQDSMVVVVDSISFVTVNGHMLKVQHVSNPGVEPGGLLQWGSTIVENIGNTGFLTPQFGPCDPWVFGLRCFSTDSLDLHFVDYPCDSVKSFIATREPVLQGRSFLPNPVAVGGTVSIKTPFEMDKVSIFSAAGIWMATINTGQDKTMVVPNLPSGLYFVRMYHENQWVGQDKLLIINN
jgi:hypothetical protein